MGSGAVTPIFHLTTTSEWSAAQARGLYERSTRGQSLNEVGFIHCSFLDQVERVADFVYGGAVELLLLVVDPSRVAAEIRYENLDGGAEVFPHIYGPMPTAAVFEVIQLHANAAGRFRLPAARP